MSVLVHAPMTATELVVSAILTDPAGATTKYPKSVEGLRIWDAQLVTGELRL